MFSTGSMSPTVPITRSHAASAPLSALVARRSCRPSGDSPGHRRSASEALMTATSAPSRTSVAVNPRPRAARSQGRRSIRASPIAPRRRAPGPASIATPSTSTTRLGESLARRQSVGGARRLDVRQRLDALEGTLDERDRSLGGSSFRSVRVEAQRHPTFATRYPWSASRSAMKLFAIRRCRSRGRSRARARRRRAARRSADCFGPRARSTRRLRVSPRPRRRHCAGPAPDAQAMPAASVTTPVKMIAARSSLRSRTDRAVRHRHPGRIQWLRRIAAGTPRMPPNAASTVHSVRVWRMSAPAPGADAARTPSRAPEHWPVRATAPRRSRR